jgi:uncharacterized protein
MKNILYTLLVFSMISCASSKKSSAQKPHIVFVVGDEEYRSEESMPMLAKILERELNAKVTMCYSVDEDGYIDPNRLDHIQGLEALKTADLMVLFTRFRALPDNELKYITDYAESGKPIVGFRTATHTFMYKDDKSKEHMNNEWTTKVLGQQWITHHGHFADGHGALTSVSILPNAKTPILNGVKPFDAYSWLYHVDGGDWKLAGDSKPFLEGKSLRSNHEAKGELGHPYDFKIESMRKLALNGIYWALGNEKKIPKNGVNADIVGEYEPNNSGFGDKYKHGIKP